MRLCSWNRVYYVVNRLRGKINRRAANVGQDRGRGGGGGGDGGIGGGRSSDAAMLIDELLDVVFTRVRPLD